MTRDTLILLAMLGVLAVLVTAAVLLIVDAMVWQPPPDITTTVTVSGGML